jgi:hypothetical protein
MLGLKYTHKSKKALASPPELSADRESAIQCSNYTIQRYKCQSEKI